jgi:HAD superfamily hydrolase (TIGR01509 family)
VSADEVAHPDAPLLAIFDHDGVLVDSLEMHSHAWLELGRREGLAITESFIRETFGMTNPSILSRLYGRELAPSEYDRLGGIKEECYREVARGQVTLMPGVRALLDALSARNVLLGMGSSAPRANLELTVERCSLTGRFATIVSLEDIRRGKPDPEVFLTAAQRAGVAPQCCVVFEDAVHGIHAAKAAGMLAVGVGTTNSLDVLKSSGSDMLAQDLVNFPVEECLRKLAAHARGGV